MTAKKIKKSPRKIETREKAARTRGWVPPSSLEAPEPPEGFHHRWIRYEFRGEQDEKNVMARLRSGYEFVMLSEYPDRVDLPSITDGKYKGVIGVGGLILMRCPIETKEDRDNYENYPTRDTFKICRVCGEIYSYYLDGEDKEIVRKAWLKVVNRR